MNPASAMNPASVFRGRSKKAILPSDSQREQALFLMNRMSSILDKSFVTLEQFLGEFDLKSEVFELSKVVDELEKRKELYKKVEQGFRRLNVLVQPRYTFSSKELGRIQRVQRWIWSLGRIVGRLNRKMDGKRCVKPSIRQNQSRKKSLSKMEKWRREVHS